MNTDPSQPPADDRGGTPGASRSDSIADRALDEMTAALRDAGAAAAGEGVPPELRRATLQALWVADADRFETRSTRRAVASRWTLRLVVAVAILGLCGALALLVANTWNRSDEESSRRVSFVRNARTTAPAAATQAAHGPQTGPSETQPAGGLASGAPPTSAPAGVVVGRVVFLGTPPSPGVYNLNGTYQCQATHPTIPDESLVVGKTGGIANVVVSLQPVEGGSPLTGPVPSRPAVIDQKGCQYIPHVMAVMTGQTVLVKNSDPFLHNVHALAIDNPAFNFGQPNIDPGHKLPALQQPERFKVKCDIHPWMGMHVSVFDHPYFAVTGADGSFSISGTLPDGAYGVTAWHEELGEKQVYVVIKNGKPATADFVFDGSKLPPN